MRVLITAGGTAEPIDRVRKITNMATGRLGSLIAEEFAKQPGTQITYLCARDALRPAAAVEETVPIGGVLELEETLTGLLRRTRYDAVIHSMAVSDYLPRRVTGARELADSIAGALLDCAQPPSREEISRIVLEQILQSGDPAGGGGKFSSRMEHMLVRMDQAPKVIGHIKRLQPHTVLVGFKLLAGVEGNRLREVARALMEKNECDFVLANDLEEIHGDRHRALLIRAGGHYETLQTKAEIAEAIVNAVVGAVR